MAEVSHHDLLVRVEATEKEVAVLDTKLNRVQKDITDMAKNVNENGAISKETQVQVKMMGRMLLAAIALLGVIFTFLNYIKVPLA